MEKMKYHLLMAFDPQQYFMSLAEQRGVSNSGASWRVVSIWKSAENQKMNRATKLGERFYTWYTVQHAHRPTTDSMGGCVQGSLWSVLAKDLWWVWELQQGSAHGKCSITTNACMSGWKEGEKKGKKKGRRLKGLSGNKYSQSLVLFLLEMVI